MVQLLRLLCGALIGLFQSSVRREAEILVLRQQINVLRRKPPKRPALNNADRLLFVWLSRACGIGGGQPGNGDPLAPRRLRSLLALTIKASRWPAEGATRDPTAYSRNELANPLWGAPRIHGELLKLGIDVGQTTVAKYMAKHRRPRSQGWRTFLRNHADGIASMDLFVVPTGSFRLLYGLLILQHGRRQIMWLGATAHPTAEWIARQLTEAYGWKAAPQYVVRDGDAVYGDIFIRRLRAMGIS